MRYLSLLYISLFISISLNAKDKNPAIEIDGQPIFISELQEAFAKNPTEDKKEFIDGYINYRLQVKEAYKQKIDTTTDFKREYSSTRIALAQNYSDSTFSHLMASKMIYERFLTDCEVFQYFIPYDNLRVFPADTLKLYNKILEERKKIIKDGIERLELKDYSEERGIFQAWETASGYLGWMKPLTLHPNVEDVLYNSKINVLSDPIRTEKGYYLIKLLNKRKAKGQIGLEQVMFNFYTIPPSQADIDSIKPTVDEVYQKLSKHPESFAELCDKFKKAQMLKQEDCFLGDFLLNDPNLPPSFITAAFELDKIGDISAPILTHYGYHIVKLVDTVSIPAYEQMKEWILFSLRKGDRGRYLSEASLKELSTNYNVKDISTSYDMMRQLATNTAPLDSLYIENIQQYHALKLFSINEDREYKISDFIRILKQNRPIKKDTDIFNFEEEPYSLSTDKLETLYNGFKISAILSYADSTLEQRHPDLKKSLDSYAESLAVYELKKQQIWNNAKKDGRGLQAYFQKNKKEFAWNEARYKGLMIYAKDAKTLNIIRESAKKINYSTVYELEDYLYKNHQIKSKDIILKQGLWRKGEDSRLDSLFDSKIESEAFVSHPFFDFIGKQIKQAEHYTDVKSQVEIAYSDALEIEWIKSLRQKNNIKLNQAILEQL